MKKLITAVAAIFACASSFAVTNHFEGFEGAWTEAPETWNSFYGSVTQTASGTDGVSSQSGSFHGSVAETSTGYTSFSRLGGYSTDFGLGYTASLGVYIDILQPGTATATRGFDISVASNNQSNGHLRDFIFHFANDTDGNMRVGATNNTNYSPRADIATLANHAVLTQGGWYTLEWTFRDAGDGSLAVDMSVIDGSSNVLFTETRNNAADDIATLVGGNRYMWVTALEGGPLLIDNTNLEAVPEPCTLAVLGLAALLKRRKAKKAVA